MDAEERTVQRAAETILKERHRPMSSKELAKRIWQRRLVKSDAVEPERSIANTIEQNIRAGREPTLVQLKGSNGDSLVALPEWKDKGPWWEEIRLAVSPDLYQKLGLAHQAKLRPTFEETIIFLLESGLRQENTSIKDGLMRQMKILDT